MRIRSHAERLKLSKNVLHSAQRSATFEPPEGAANVSVTVLASDASLWQVTTWLELSPSERAQAMMQQARGGIVT